MRDHGNAVKANNAADNPISRFSFLQFSSFCEGFDSMSTPLLIVTLVLTALAAPVQRCNISDVQLSLPSNNRTAFSKPTSPLTSLVLGVGVQNYTCSTAGTYT